MQVRLLRLVEAWKSINSETSPLKDLLEVREKNSLGTRSNDSDELIHCQGSKLAKNSFAYPTAIAWNGAPKEIKTSNTLQKAKMLIRKYVQTLPRAL